MFKLRKYDDKEVEEIKHLYWQIDNYFKELGLEKETKRTPMGLTKEIYDIADTTLRRCLSYGTEKHEKEKEKERKRAKMRRALNKIAENESIEDKETTRKKEIISREIHKNIKKRRLKKFYIENQGEELTLNNDMGELFRKMTLNNITAKMIEYIQKNSGNFHLNDVYMNFGEDGLKNLEYLYENGYIGKL